MRAVWGALVLATGARMYLILGRITSFRTRALDASPVEPTASRMLQRRQCHLSDVLLGSCGGSVVRADEEVVLRQGPSQVVY